MTTLATLRETLKAAEREAKAADQAASDAAQLAAYLATRQMPTDGVLVGAMRAQAQAHKALKAARQAYYEALAVDRDTAPLARDNKPFSIFKS